MTFKRLTRAQEFWRELTCLLVGHRWTFPERRYTELTREEYDAAHAMTSHMHFPPNPYWHDITSWSCKCKRCRIKSNEWPTYPIWKEVWWMVKNFGFSWKICVSLAWKSRAPWWYRVRQATVHGFLFAVEQTWLGWWWHQWGWPSWPGLVASDLGQKLWREEYE